MGYNDYSASIQRGIDCYGEKKNHMVQNPGHVDESVWEKAKAAAAKSGYHDKWALTTSIYKKMGGVFHKSE